jgi:hypothetical protein
MYQMAIATKNDDPERIARFQDAKQHVKEARRYRSPDGIEGFVQCTGTIGLEQKIDAQLRESPNASERRRPQQAERAK